MAKYLHCSFAGSYYVECKIIEQRNYDFDKDANEHTKILAQSFKSLKEDRGPGYMIEYTDPVYGFLEARWVPEEYVENE